MRDFGDVTTEEMAQALARPDESRTRQDALELLEAAARGENITKDALRVVGGLRFRVWTQEEESSHGAQDRQVA